jgi:hypothetical protein
MENIWEDEDLDEELLEACKLVDGLKKIPSESKLISKYKPKSSRKYTKHVLPFATQVKQYQDRLYFSTGQDISFVEARARLSKIKKDEENKEKLAVERNKKISIKRRQKPFVIPDDFDSDSETIAIDPR